MILSRDDYFKCINDIIGTNTDDASVEFLENMTDTYNAMEEEATKNTAQETEWKQKYNELDASWRKKYKERFFSSNGRSSNPNNSYETPEKIVNSETITIEDLFK